MHALSFVQFDALNLQKSNPNWSKVGIKDLQLKSNRPSTDKMLYTAIIMHQS